MQKDNNKEFKNPNFEDQSKSNVSNDTGMLLDALINGAKQLETKDHDLEAKRQKKKKHKKLLYNELDM